MKKELAPYKKPRGSWGLVDPRTKVVPSKKRYIRRPKNGTLYEF